VGEQKENCEKKVLQFEVVLEESLEISRGEPRDESIAVLRVLEDSLMFKGTTKRKSYCSLKTYK
jgi:hypothetical protein